VLKYLNKNEIIIIPSSINIFLMLKFSISTKFRHIDLKAETHKTVAASIFDVQTAPIVGMVVIFQPQFHPRDREMASG